LALIAGFICRGSGGVFTAEVTEVTEEKRSGPVGKGLSAGGMGRSVDGEWEK
jgi:hypothetical protein